MRQGAQGWCTGMTHRDGMGKEVGAGFRMGNRCTPMADSCQCMEKPLQYCKVISLRLKKKKNLPSMQETWVRSLGWEDPMEKEMATHSCLENPLDRGAWQARVHGVAKSRTRLSG